MGSIDISQITNKVDILLSRYEKVMNENKTLKAKLDVMETKVNALNISSIDTKSSLNTDEVNYLKSEIKARDEKINELYDEINKRDKQKIS